MRTLFILQVVVALACPMPPAVAGTPEARRGEVLWRKCSACHSVEPQGRNRVGPRLHGLFGRQAGSVADFRYTEALRNSGIVWNEETLDRFLKDAESMVPGTKMSGGLSLERDRADLIAWLKQVAGGPGDTR